MFHINLFEPYINKKTWKAVKKVLKKKSLSQGEEVNEFEELVSYYCDDFNRAVATDSGTSALHLAYILAGIGEGDEVLTTCLTCTATNIPLLHLKAKPVFCDINEHDLNISVEDIKNKVNNKTKAIVVVHFGGIPVDYDEIYEVASYYGIPVIQDAAQAFGASYRGKKVGGFGDFTTFSFQAIKTLTTIDGGMIMLNNPEMVDRAKRLRWFGIDRSKKVERDNQIVWPREITYDIDEPGFKYNMNNVTATIGLANLKGINKVLKRRVEIEDYYRTFLTNVPGIKLLKPAKDRESSNWLFQVLVENREDFQVMMKEAGIEVNVSHTRNDLYKIFGGKRLDLPNMNKLEDHYVCLPIHHKLSCEDINNVVQTIRKGW